MIVIESYHIKLDSDLMELIFSAQSANKEVISFIDPFCGEMVLKTIGRDQLAYISTVSFA